jgi:DNA polymerase-3 subunit delta'
LKILIIGHQKIISFLNKSIGNRKLAHAYLFFGPEQIGKRLVALEFAKSLQCQNNKARIGSLSFCGQCTSCLAIEKEAHPDVLFIRPEVVEEKNKKREKDISIVQVRSVQHQLSLSPYFGPYKIVIIDTAEKIQRDAANALLKTLEEPPKKSIIILISQSSKVLLPTIISRCLLIKFSLVSQKEIYRSLASELKRKYSEVEIRKALRQSLGRPGLVLTQLEEPKDAQGYKVVLGNLNKILKDNLAARFKYAELMAKDMKKAQGVLGQWEIIFRDLLLYKTGCSDLSNAVDFGIKKESAENSIIFVADKIWDISGIKKIIRKISETKKIISNPSFNARLALEVLMLNL